MGPKDDVEDHGEAGGTSSRSKVPMLERYVSRHHAPNHIIKDKSDGIMTRKKLKSRCLLPEFEPKNVRYALDNER